MIDSVIRPSAASIRPARVDNGSALSVRNGTPIQIAASTTNHGAMNAIPMRAISLGLLSESESIGQSSMNARLHIASSRDAPRVESSAITGTCAASRSQTTGISRRL
jgi:hypothetical protein